MEPSIRVALALLLFAATHIGLALPRVRGALVARLGHWGFIWTFAAVAALTFGFAISSYASERGSGAPGLDLGRVAALRPFLVGAIAAGIALMAGSMAEYARSPYAAFPPRAPEPRGLARVTRHPFFVGVALLGCSHALLAAHLVDAVAMGGLGLFALVGAGFQDRKLTALRGAAYADYVARSSTLPFAAIASGRQQLVWRELPLRALLLGVLLAWILRAAHAHLFDRGGAYVTGAVVGGALLILAAEWRRERGRARALAAPPARG